LITALLGDGRDARNPRVDYEPSEQAEDRRPAAEAPTEYDRASQGKAPRKRGDLLAMAQALIAGELFTSHRRVWRTNDGGERVLVARVKRTYG
jgi:hypothetical protein